MRIIRYVFTALSLLCSVSLMTANTWASLEAEQAALAQISQALEEAKASLKNLEAEASANQARAAEEQKTVLEATTAKASAQALLDNLTTQQATRPNADTERKLKDAEYELMMAERKLSSAQKALERAEKKVLESAAEQKTLQQQISQTEKSAADQKNLVEKIKANAAAQATQTSQKSAEEAARKEAEARANQLAAQQKAAEEAARQAAAAEAQAKQQALVKQLGVDLSDCQPLPTNPPGTELTAIDMQLQAFALGELRRVNRLLEEKPENDSPPLSPAPVLSGSRLKPCDPAQWQALKFSYLGNGQYRLETPVLAGEQQFIVKDVLPPLRRVIPDSDNGAVYVFFLDVKFPGRYKLSAYKKTLFDQAPQE